MSVPETPQLIGFEIGTLLGRGGMASVWEARQLSLDRNVAIKVLDSSLALSEDDVRLFVEEARLAARLTHTNLVSVFDVANQSGVYYYVMELIRGYDVGSWIKRKGRIDPAESLVVAESIATALGYAWKQVGLIHCDIKPANIMIDADGTVKLADLGVARSVRGTHGNDEEKDEITGTPHYMAPEQITGERQLDCRTDMYGLGATLYQMVTGKKMFSDDDEEEVMRLQCQDQAPDARELNPAISAGYAAFLAKLLAKNPDERPANWQAALKDMQLVRRGQMPLGIGKMSGLSSMRMHLPSADLVDFSEETEVPGGGQARIGLKNHVSGYLALFGGGGSKTTSIPKWLIPIILFVIFMIGFMLTLLLLRG